MLDDGGLGSFHFLRPWWLLLLPLLLWLYLRLRRAYSSALQWRDVIAPHLLQHLTLDGTTAASRGTWRVRPYQLMALAMLLAVLALAGPSWQPEITPFTEDRAALVVALELTPSMLAEDQPPTRLERAKQKLRDLLTRRKGARTALIAYAGSAHTVLPLTDDSSLIELYLESLTPALMPEAGADAAAALALAEQMLAAESAPGTILFMTDGIDRTLAGAFKNPQRQAQILLLAFGSDAGGPIRADDAISGGIAPGVDMGGLQAVAAAAGGELWRSTVDMADIDQLLRQVRSHLVNALSDDASMRWHDAGYYLVWPLALLLLLWARRGWTVQWS